MGNRATRFEEQINLLKKRGMILDLDENKIKEVLLDIGYYRLGFYWHPFEIDDAHTFEVGTLFSNAVNLYYIDVDLRQILVKYINRIEINFRTKLIYYVSNKYKGSPTWFIDKSIINDEFADNIKQYYNDDFKRNNRAISLHHNKHINDRFAPAWKTIEFFTFGSNVKIFKSLRNIEIKERISSLYEIKNVNKFVNFLDTIVFIRNTCAHCGVLFDLHTPIGISKIPDIIFNNNNRNSLYSSIQVILYILGKISENRKNDMQKELNDLFNKYKDNNVIKCLIKNSIGYNFN